jgi:dTMP kinase
MAGIFLSLDGLDGAGKSTQCRLLAEWLRGRGQEVVCCADPGGTALGQAIRHLLLDPALPLCLTSEMLLFMASRAQLVHEVIRPALEAGKTVLCDRFLLANVVYQGHAGGMDPEEVRRIGLVATGGLEPVLTFVLDLPLVQAASRRKAHADRMESRDEDFFRRVREGFLAEARRRPERHRVIDASGALEDAQQRIQHETARLLDGVS